MGEGDVARVVVTGAAGYVGGRLVEKLVENGHDVVPAVRRPCPWLPSAVVVDLCADPEERVAALFEGADAVVHLAGASETVTARDPDRALTDTVVSARRTADAAAAAGARYVYLSTVHVYGPVVSTGLPVAATSDLSSQDAPIVIDERHPAEPRHPYAVSRRAGEFLAHAAGRADPIILRLSNAVGPPLDGRVDRWTLVASELCVAAANGEDLVLRSSGVQTRDFIALSTVCRAIEAAATGRVAPGTYNLSSGTPHTVMQLAEMVASVAEELTSRRPAIRHPEHRGRRPRAVELRNGALFDQVDGPQDDVRDEIRSTMAMCLGAGVQG